MKCSKCSNEATVNWQLVWTRWDVDKDGDLRTFPTEYGNCIDNQFFCDRCYAESLEEEIWRWNRLKKELMEVSKIDKD
ncbi:MAG: hypothetical protein GY853_16530 [PVC group bacterium]|nr:hypothetical protein [PVC group bacterium]